VKLNFAITGPRDRVAAELVQAATDSPETEIRAALSDYITRTCDPDARVSVGVSVQVQGDD
jgi:hypothetical protein